MVSSLFDETARSFAAGTDAQLARNRYTRGERFVEAVLASTPRPGDVLDYGCGPGRLAHLIGRQGYRVLGVDTSKGMIEEARRLDLGGTAVRFELCDENGDELESNRYDAVVCSSVIEYVKDYKRLVGNFRRCLKPQGSLILSYANRYSLWRRYAEWKSSRREPHYALQHNLWNLVECARQLRSCGFAIFGVAKFFNSPLDQHRILAVVGKLELVGTLGLVTARPVEVRRD
jgi:2-polyprenyl-3-methyl-5-hydroxy-6-metoxy-1,4-benzoquinol methylase